MRVCIIGGCGHFERALAGIADREGCTLAGWFAQDAMDQPERVAGRLRQLGIHAPYYQDLPAMLEQLRPDICVVDNAFHRHAWAASLCLQRGIHTLCEKPLALEFEALHALEAAQAKSGALLWAMLSARYDPWFYTAKRLVDAGAVGRVRMVNAQKSYRLGKRPPMYTRRDTYGGTIAWVGIHALDLIAYVSGLGARSIYAQHSAACNHGLGELEMTALITLRMQEAVLACANVDYLRPAAAPTHDDDRVRIAGTRGVLEVYGRSVTLINESGVSQPPVQTPPTLWKGFAAACRGEAGGLISTRASIEATRMALLARQSADTGQPVWFH